jgi:hypothetical protein
MTAILPTGAFMNPSRPEDAEYFDPGQVAYIVQDGSKFRVWTSFGDLGEKWNIGTFHDAKHDQTFRRLGYFKVIGKAVFATGEKTGNVPNRKLSHCVFK